LWTRVNAASFLTNDEKRAAAGDAAGEDLTADAVEGKYSES